MEKHETWLELKPQSIPIGLNPLRSHFICKVKVIGSESEIPKGNSWIIKRTADGKIPRFKVRLVVDGYKQEKGLNYNETFSPVVRPEVLRLILALAIEDPDATVEQIDIVTAFLYGKVQEEIYMRTPAGASLKPRVVKLLKSLYGLKQAPRQWHSVIDQFLIHDCSFTKVNSTPCLYVKGQNSTKKLIVSLYVDDITMVGNSGMIAEFKAKLKQRFDISDFGEIKTCIGIQIDRDKSQGITFLHQAQFLEDLLKKTKMDAANTVPTPALQGMRLTKQMSPHDTDDFRAIKGLEERLPYRATVSSLLWLLHTRPEIAFAVGELSRYVTNPGPNHYAALKRLLRYLKGTRDYGILYKTSGSFPVLKLEAYSDSDWAQDLDTRRSTTGFLIRLNGNIISTKSKQQSSTALSSCEAETVAMGSAAQELVALRSILLGWDSQLKGHPISSATDNGAISFAKDGGQYSKMKHINLREHFLRDLVKSNEIVPKHINTACNPADVFTKALGPVKFRQHRDFLNIVSRSSIPTLEGGN